jgi:hypothetical protein
LQAGFARIDFSKGSRELQVSNVVKLLIDNNSTDVVLTPAAIPTPDGTSIYLLKISFFQLVGGVQYPLKDGEFNSLAVVEIA